MKPKFGKGWIAVSAGALFLSGCCFLHLFWRQSVRPMTYRTHGSIPSGWIPEIKSAHRTWNKTWPLFTYGGGGGNPALDPNDGVNSVFRAFSSLDFLAGTVPWTSGCGVVDTDMVWNSRFTFHIDCRQYDVQTVALHEFGHYGVLEHVICPSSSVMLASYQGCRRSLSGCDAFGMFVSNAVPLCFPAMGICFPSFFALPASTKSDEEDQPVAKLVQEHAQELMQIWNGDSDLRATADTVGEFYARMVQDWEAGLNTPSQQVFTQERYNELDAQIISRFYASASTPLRSDLDALRTHLQSKVGLTFSDIFLSDLGYYPGNPGDTDDGGSTCTDCPQPIQQ